MPRKKVTVKLCTRCNRPNKRGGNTRICEACFKESPKKAKRLPEAPTHKTCSHCRTEKPASEFYKNAGRPDWLSIYCKVCHSAKESARYSNGKEKARDGRLWSRYNISLEEYNQMLIAQGNKCALCPREHTATKPLHVDHSHQEPVIVRGLLCSRCNRMKLGSLTLEDVNQLQAYLTQPPAIQVVGERLVPIGMEKGTGKRRRRYKHYPKKQEEKHAKVFPDAQPS